MYRSLEPRPEEQDAGFQNVIEALGQPHRVFKADDGVLRVERVEEPG